VSTHTAAAMSTALRRAARRFASGVAVVTTCGGDEIFAKTVSSFHALSLDPPLVSVSITERSPLVGAIESAGFFAVSVLRLDQQHVSRHCAARCRGRAAGGLGGIPIAAAATGAPIISGCLSFFDCRLEQVLGAGDHRIVIGRVVMADGAAGEPLLYYDGDYHRLTGFGATP